MAFLATRRDGTMSLRRGDARRAPVPPRNPRDARPEAQRSTNFRSCPRNAARTPNAASPLPTASMPPGDTIRPARGTSHASTRVMVEDLRCDDPDHAGCQAGCRIQWKELGFAASRRKAINRDVAPETRHRGAARSGFTECPDRPVEHGRSRRIPLSSQEFLRATEPHRVPSRRGRSCARSSAATSRLRTFVRDVAGIVMNEPRRIGPRKSLTELGRSAPDR